MPSIISYHQKFPAVDFTASPFASPLYLLAKPAGSRCNLACKYCYYLEKSLLFEKHSPQVMDDALLEKFIHDYIGAQTTQEVLFTWHGGEPLMRPLQFYKKAVALQRKYAAGRRIDNCLQTNGTLLTEEWCRFFKERGWLVGVSVDGTQEMHDAYRKAKGGGPSHHKVMQGIRLLQKHGVEWNALAVVNDFNAEHPKEFYRFFKEIGCRFIQFTPIVERMLTHADGRQLAAVEEEGTEGMMPFSVSPEQWGDFLIGIFDEWVKEDVGEYFVQLFDATLANWMGVQPGICTLARTCGHAGAIEWNGDVFACDHFVFPQYRLGNLREKSLVEMMYSPKQREFGRAKQTALPRQCRECRWLFACNGECPKNRFARTADGEKGLNFLCSGYRRFFEHVAPYMDWMKRELMANRPPAGIVDLLRNDPRAFG